MLTFFVDFSMPNEGTRMSTLKPFSLKLCVAFVISATFLGAAGCGGGNSSSERSPSSDGSQDKPDLSPNDPELGPNPIDTGFLSFRGVQLPLCGGKIGESQPFTGKSELFKLHLYDDAGNIRQSLNQFKDGVLVTDIPVGQRTTFTYEFKSNDYLFVQGIQTFLDVPAVDGANGHSEFLTCECTSRKYQVRLHSDIPHEQTTNYLLTDIDAIPSMSDFLLNPQGTIQACEGHRLAAVQNQVAANGRIYQTARYSIVTLGTETDLDIELKHQATGERLVTADKNAIGISGLVYLGHSTARLFAQQKSLHTTSSMLAKFESPVPAQTFISATHLNPLGGVEEVMKPVSTGTDNVHLEFPSWSIQSFSYDAANKTFNLSV